MNDDLSFRSGAEPSADSLDVRTRDRGTALPLVMVITIVLGALVVSISAYATTNLRYGHVTADRSDRLSAADAGMRYAIDQLKLRNAACIIDTTLTELPAADVDFNEATATVRCQRIAGAVEAIQAWAAVITGEGTPTGHLISTQGGNSQPKILGGPVYMSRVNSTAFDLGPVLEIENGSLYYYDGGACTSPVLKSAPNPPIPGQTILPSALRFTPDLIFGPICTRRPWTELFPSPAVAPALSAAEFPTRRGDLPIGAPSLPPGIEGGYELLGSGNNTCHVFHPGRYVTPPDSSSTGSYFRTGDYLFDLPDSNAVVEIRQGTATAGRPNPVTTKPATNEIPPNAHCATAQSNDPAPPNQFGATFYLAGSSRIQVLNQGSLEIHARQQERSFVSIHALCDPAQGWCTEAGPAPPSTLRSPASTDRNIVLTSSGNNRELVAHGMIYAPLAQMEFGNVTNTAVQKLYGGLVIARLILQSSASAQNFEIAVPTSPITSHIELTSTAVKNGETSIRAVVEYRPYEENIAQRIAVNSWRVCDTPDC